MLHLLIALTLAPPLTASDFFPAIAGTARTFYDLPDQTNSVDEVGAPITFGGSPATPITTKDGAKLVNIAYYRIEPTAVYLLGYDPKNPLPQPMPILQYDGKPTKWSFDGVTSADRNGEELHLTGESKSTADQAVFGKKLPAIEVTIQAQIGVGKFQEQDEQVAIYAKGVGMVQLTTKRKIGKNKPQTALRRLVKLEEAKSSG
jgi:hypothetical protein